MTDGAEGERAVLVGPTTAGGQMRAAPAELVWADEFGTELAQILRRAHDAVQAMEADGRMQVSRLRVEAQQQLVRLQADAERYAEAVRQEAEDYAARLRTEAERYALETREQARLTAEAHLRLNEQLLACWSGLARQVEAAEVRAPAVAPMPEPVRRPGRWTPILQEAPQPRGDRPFFAPLVEGEFRPAVG